MAPCPSLTVDQLPSPWSYNGWPDSLNPPKAPAASTGLKLETVRSAACGPRFPKLLLELPFVPLV